MIAALGGLLRWSLFIAAVATGAYFGTILLLPGLLMSVAMHGAAEFVGLNQMAYPGRGDALTRIGARPDPNLLLATCAFDLSQQYVALSADLPAAGDWSITIYGEDGRPFFYAANEAGAGPTLDALLLGPGDAARDQAGLMLQIPSPGFRGLVLIRAQIDSEAQLAEIDRVRHQASCRSVPR